MRPAAAAILEGMPDPRDLRRAEHQGTTFISVGSAVLFCYPAGDAAMRNVAVAVLRQLGFGGQAVAAVMGLTENYVATLHNRALREGTAGVVRDNGRPRKLAGASRARARRCGEPTVRRAEFPWRDRVLKKRMPAAEKQRENRGRRAGYSPGGPLHNRPDNGLVPVPERELT